MTIELADIGKDYGGKNILDGFSLTFESDHSYVVTGGEGSGKTTLIRIMLGLEKPDRGRMSLLGDYKYPFLNAGVVFQEDRLVEHATAVENITMVNRNNFPTVAREELGKLLPPECASMKVRDLTPEQRRVVAIVRACCVPFDMLIMDEPFSGLSPEMREKVTAFIRDKQARNPLLIATRDPSGISFARVVKLHNI